jgi:regulator of sigma E protease
MNLVLERGGERQTVSLVSTEETMTDEFGNQARVGRLGVQAAQALGGGAGREQLPPHRLLGAAVDMTVNTVNSMVVALGQVITGKRSVKELGGPLKIAEVSGQQATLGWLPFFWLMVVISINLGFINLLPIPLLDGGHLLFYAIEGVRRKPIRPEAQEWAFRTGLAVLLALMIFITFNDLASFGLFRGLGG